MCRFSDLSEPGALLGGLVYLAREQRGGTVYHYRKPSCGRGGGVRYFCRHLYSEIGGAAANGSGDMDEKQSVCEFRVPLPVEG